MPTPTHTPTGTPSPTATPTITRTRVPSPTPGPSPTPYPTPDYYASSLGDDFIFSGRTPDCELPCWQGLVVSESNTEDVQVMFDTVFGFNGTYDFFPEDASQSEFVPGLIYARHWWIFRQMGIITEESFDIMVWAGEDTRIVEAIRLIGWSDRFRPYANPQRILRELGTPSRILTPPIDPTQDHVWASTTLMLVYYEGITLFYTHVYVPIRYSNPQDYTGGVAELCLRSLPSTSLSFFEVEVYLTEPLQSELDALSPFQEFYLGTYMRDWPPIQDVWGVSPEELTQLAQEQWNVCLYADIED